MVWRLHPACSARRGAGPEAPEKTAAALRTQVRSDSVVMGEALRGAGDLGRDPVHHGAASPTTHTVNLAGFNSTSDTTKPPPVMTLLPKVILRRGLAPIYLSP